MKDFLQGVAYGLVGGVIFSAALTVNSDLFDEYVKLKNECELNLPRSQTCVMQLVPKE